MFSQRLRELRKEQGLSLRELAKILNISYSALGKYERSEREPDFDTLEKISDFFKVRIDWLLGRTYIKTLDEYIYSTDVQHLGDKIKNSPTEIRSIATNIIDSVFLMLYHHLKIEDKEYLKTLESIFNHLWFLLLSCKDIERTLDIDRDIDEFLKNKSELNKLLDTLFKNFIKQPKKSLPEGGSDNTKQ